MADRDVFREIPLAEFRRRHDLMSERINVGEVLENKTEPLVEAYSTNAHMERNDIAVNFTVRLEKLDEPPMDPLGVCAVKLIFYSGLQLQPLTAVERVACIHPQSPNGLDSAAIWHFAHDNPFRTANFHVIYEGFLTRWVDNDLSDESRDKFYHPERTNLTVNSPLLHQRSPFRAPVEREER